MHRSSITITMMVTLILGFASLVKAMRFDLETGATKCITEDIKINAMTIGKYNIVKPVEGFPLSAEDRITVRVTSPLGNNYHYADRKESGNFAFTTGEAGDYMACFWAAKQSPDKSLSINFEWKSGLAAKDWSKVAKKGQVEMMELELKKLYDSVTMVHEEMFNLRAREEMMQHLIRSTNAKMATFSFFSLIICLSVAAMQLWHLKAFFQRKKLI
ncbi:transmembrane emp24 domain-containing protein p24delta9-like [Bidens hawaiensis]|uniref:transmembrane emp24 domain-containing protein p24delta9-like n=1 Tax=Bidens hawaiensis TaxID=980011 RepID=UPI00404B1B35